MQPPGRTCCDDGTCLNGLECDPMTMTCTDAPRAAPRAFVIPADYTVTQCLSDGVVVQSPTPDAMVPPIGSFFINTAAAPTDPADICIDCGQFGAVVTAVGEPQPCDSQGAPCVEVQLTTRPALLSEIFTPEALQIGNLTEFSGATLFEATGCGEASSRRLAGLAGPGRGLLQSFGRPSVARCAGWKSVNSDGRCRYSNCFVGNDPFPEDPNCFGCDGNDCNNGCGPIEGIGSQAPDELDFVFDFANACCSRDHCYSSTSFTKLECDLGFLADNLISCERVQGFGRPGFVLRILSGIAPIANLVRCETYALLYFTAVLVDGATPEADAKQLTTAHERSEECTARCPSMQRAGGQGTTVLRVDLLRPGPFPYTYDMFAAPDALTIEDEAGDVLFTTGGLVSGQASGTAVLGSGSGSTVVTVTMDAPNVGTSWDLFIGCAE